VRTQRAQPRREGGRRCTHWRPCTAAGCATRPPRAPRGGPRRGSPIRPGSPTTPPRRIWRARAEQTREAGGSESGAEESRQQRPVASAGMARQAGEEAAAQSEGTRGRGGAFSRKEGATGGGGRDGADERSRSGGGKENPRRTCPRPLLAPAESIDGLRGCDQAEGPIITDSPHLRAVRSRPGLSSAGVLWWLQKIRDPRPTHVRARDGRRRHPPPLAAR